MRAGEMPSHQFGALGLGESLSEVDSICSRSGAAAGKGAVRMFPLDGTFEQQPENRDSRVLRPLIRNAKAQRVEDARRRNLSR